MPDRSPDPPADPEHDDEATPDKATLRRRLLAARHGLDRDGRASARIVEAVRSLPEAASADRVLGYAAFGSEVDLDGLLAGWLDDGRAVHLPFVVGDDLGIAAVRDLDADLAPGWGGVREPDPARRRPVDPATLDLAVVPGVGFDPAGRRLGYGGGHFDRLLARLAPRAAIVGVAFSAQVVASLPADAHDVAVDVVVTESGAHRVRASDG